MEVNTSTTGDEVTQKIHAILKPMEYTRVDKIVDIVFATAEDKELSSLDEPKSNEAAEVYSQDRTPLQDINDKKSAAIKKLSVNRDSILRKVKHSMYANADDSIRAVVVVSKHYDKDSDYWYAYHEKPQREFLANAKNGFYLMAMMDKEEVYAVPFNVMDAQWNSLGETVRKDGSMYKHIVLDDIDGIIKLRVRTKDNLVDLSAYKVG